MLQKYYECYKHGIIREFHKFDTLAEALEYKRVEEIVRHNIVSRIETKWRFKRAAHIEHGLRKGDKRIVRDKITFDTYDEFETILLNEVLV